MNEIHIHNEILNNLKQDLIVIIEYLKGNVSTSMPKNLITKLNSIQKNLVPCEWMLFGSWINTTSLFDYLKSFLIKQDFLFNLIHDRKCEISPILPLGKMYDPLDTISSFLLYYAQENKVNIYLY